MRVLLWVVGIVVLLLVAALFLVPALIDERRLIGLAAEKIEAESGLRVEIGGEAFLSLFPDVALTTSQVAVSVPDGSAEITADYLQAGVALIPLLSGRVEMDSITVEGLTLTRTLDEDAAAAARSAELDTSGMSRAELDAFYAARSEARKAARDDAAAALAAPLALQVGELVLRDIRVRSVDGNGELLGELQLRRLTGRDLNTAGRPIPISAQLVIPGEAPQQAINAVVNGSARVALDSRRATLSDIRVVVTGATAEQLELTLNGEAALDRQTADLEIHLAIGELRGDGSLRFDNFGSPMIDADLELTTLDPALLLLAGPDAAQAAPETPEPAGDGDAPLPLHTLRMIDTAATLTIDTVLLDAHQLQNVQAQLRVVDGVATLDPVTATVHGGSIDVTAELNGRYNTATVSTAGGVTGLDLAPAVAALDSGMRARGSADLRWELAGSGRSRNELTQSLNGPIEFSTADVTLEGIALQRMFCQAVALANQEKLVAQFPRDTQFEALSASVQLDNGVARLDPLTAQLPTVALDGTGTLSLDTRDLRASLRARLDPDLGEFDPACRIDERYTALRWPVECRGNLAGSPGDWCRVDTTQILKDLAEYEARQAIEKKAGKLLKKLIN